MSVAHHRRRTSVVRYAAGHWTVTGKVDGDFGGGTTTYAVSGGVDKAW
jgi:hypothetical protein